MASRPRVAVDVHQEWTARRVLDEQPGLLGGLSERSLLGQLVCVDVTPRLHPDAEATVPVQHRAPRPDHEARRRHVHGIGVLIEGMLQSIDLGDEPLDR